jgi:hypothetical protein
MSNTVEMEEMEALLALLRTYVIASHETEVALYTERDPNAFLPRIRRLEQFFANGVSAGISASLPKFDDEERAIFTSKAARLVPPPIFKVKRWNHPREGIFYQAYLGSSTPAKRTSYFESLLARKQGDGLKIVARYTVCLACFSTGQHGGTRCPDCDALGWNYLEGLKLTSFGAPEETRHIEAPTLPAFVPEYDSD